MANGLVAVVKGFVEDTTDVLSTKAGPLLESFTRKTGDAVADNANAIDETESGVKQSFDGIAKSGRGDDVPTGEVPAGDGTPDDATSPLHQKISTILNPGEDAPGEDVPYTGARSLSPEEQEAQEAVQAQAAYERIRSTTGDTQRIADNTGIDEGVLSRVKNHLFQQEHEMPVPPDGHLVTKQFTPDISIADLWEKADVGKLNPEERQQFQALMQHESVESSLMLQGMPYRSADPAAWQDGVNWPSAEHFGAHDISPHSSYAGDPWRGWKNLGFGEPPTPPIAGDLSNIDSVVADVRKRVGI